MDKKQLNYGIWSKVCSFVKERPLAQAGLSGFALVSAAYVAVQEVENAARKQVRDSLLAVQETAQHAVEEAVSEIERTAEYWAQNPKLRSLSLELDQVHRNGGHLSTSTAQEGARDWFASLSQIMGFEGFFLINPEGISIASSRDENLGTPNLLMNLSGIKKKVFSGITCLSPPVPSDVPLPTKSRELQAGRATMFALAPIKDSEGTVIAALALRVNPWDYLFHTLELASLGETGATYALSGDGLILGPHQSFRELMDIGLMEEGTEEVASLMSLDPGTDLRFAGADLRKASAGLTVMAEEAIKGNSGINLAGYRDYRGADVVGAWTWIEDPGIVIATEQETKEAFAWLGLVKLAIYGLTAISCLMLGVVFLLLEFSRRSSAHAEDLRIEGELARQQADFRAQFLARMSHEIRTPLNGIIGMLSAFDFEEPKENQREKLEISQQASFSLMRILNDILDFAKVDKGEMEFESVPYDPRKLCKEACDSFRDTATSKGLQLDMDICSETPEVLLADSGRIRQVLLNLLGNAIKFTDCGSVTLSVCSETLSRGRSRTRFSIKDTGPGMRKESMKDIFTPFVQADETISRKFGGTGLGLSISHSIVSGLGGDLKVKSKLGHGTEFYFEIIQDVVKLATNPPPEEAKGKEVDLPSHFPLSILVVDDNQINLRVAKAHLEKLGCTVFTAASGKEALAAVQEQAFAGILMDLEMPGWDGIQTTAEIRKLPGMDSVPIIAATAHALPEYREKCLAGGMDDFMSKPLLKPELQRVLSLIASASEPQIPEGTPA